MDRYVGAMQGPDSSLEVNVRGFSAGSFAGLAFLHILWSIPKVTTKGCLGAIACPPSLLNMSRAKADDQLHLIHFESDRLCSWKPGPKQMQDCCTSYTYITNEIASYKGHFGPDEHDYSHWMALNLPQGRIALRVLLFIRPEAASKAKRDASYKLNPELELFIEQAMEHLSTWKETEGGKVLRMGKDAIQQGETISTEVELRDRLIDLVSVGDLRHKPEALFTLFRQFLTRISLPRLIHFLDLVLPQLMPVQAAWAGEEKTLWSCHYIRCLRDKQSANTTPRVQISVVTREAMKTLFPKRKFENIRTSFERKFSFQISCLLSTVFNVDHFIMYITPRYFWLRVGWVGTYLRFLAFSSAAMGV